MLPMPAMNFWSISSVFSFAWRAASICPKYSHDIAVSSGSMPRCASSVTSFSMVSASVTNISPNVRGSTKRSCPPCVKLITTWVCFAVVSRELFVRISCPDIPRWMTSTSSPSRRSRRYLPLRSTPVILWLTSRCANCLRLWWRRTERMPSTSTALIFLPTTSRSRSRRTTSTSGSSGISHPDPVPPVGRGADRLALQPFPRDLCCRLFGRLLRTPFARAVLLVAEEHRGEEPLGVIGPFVTHLVAGQLVASSGCELLQPRLVVLPAGPRRLLADTALEQREDELGGGLEAAVEVHRGDDRLHCVGEDRRLGPPTGRVLALAQAQGRAETELLRDVGERLGTDHRRAELGQLALGELRVLLVREAGDHESEHRVAEEFEPLVGLLDALLGAVRTVSERAVEEIVVDERPAQRELQSCVECRVDGTAPPSGHHNGRLRFDVLAARPRPRCVS